MLSNKHGPSGWIPIEADPGKGDPRLLYGSRGDPPWWVGTRGDPWGWLYDKKKIPIYAVLNLKKVGLKIRKIGSQKKPEWEKYALRRLMINDQRLTINEVKMLRTQYLKPGTNSKM